MLFRSSEEDNVISRTFRRVGQVWELYGIPALLVASVAVNCCSQIDQERALYNFNNTNGLLELSYHAAKVSAHACTSSTQITTSIINFMICIA